MKFSFLGLTLDFTPLIHLYLMLRCELSHDKHLERSGIVEINVVRIQPQTEVSLKIEG